ncbi:MAG: OmpH family outer membrane protein [Planctomycetota bacterium]
MKSNMKHITGRTLLLIGLLLGLASVVGAGEKEQRLAMVNVSLVFEKYDKVADIERRLNAIYAPEQDKLNQQAEKLKKRNKELEQFFNTAEQSEQVLDTVQKLRRDQYFFEKDLNNLNMRMQKSYTKEMREVLSDIRVTIRAVAEKGGFDLALRSPDTEDPEISETDPRKTDPAADDRRTMLQKIAPKTVAQLLERFNRNPVLFGAKTVDITEEILKKLNDEYAKRGKLGK